MTEFKSCADKYEIIKVDEGEGIVYGWGMVSILNDEPYYDLQNHHIPDHVMRKMSTEFMEDVRTNLDMHDGEATGLVVHSFPLTKEFKEALGIECDKTGWLVGVKPCPESFAKFQSGEFTGFSIGGSGKLVEVE